MTTPLDRIRIGAVSLAIIFVASVAGFHFIGGYPWVESVWMVVVTISTVGYGERSTGDTATQLLSISVIVLGVSAGFYTIGGFMELLFQGEVQKALGTRRMTREISRLRGQVVVCGFGRLGRELVTQLKHRGQACVVIDWDPARIKMAQEEKQWAINGDATQDEVLRQAGLEFASTLVSALPTDAANVFITLTARNMNPNIQIISVAEQLSSYPKLQQVGADRVVMPQLVGARRMERMITRPSTADLIDLLSEASRLEVELDELIVPTGCQLEGKTLTGTGIKDQFDLLVVGIKTSVGELKFNPPGDYSFTCGDIVMLLGKQDDIKRFKSQFSI